MTGIRTIAIALGRLAQSMADTTERLKAWSAMYELKPSDGEDDDDPLIP